MALFRRRRADGTDDTWTICRDGHVVTEFEGKEARQTQQIVSHPRRHVAERIAEQERAGFTRVGA